MKSCCRCQSPANTLMQFDYSAAELWLEDVPGPVTPGSGYLLCDEHANAMSGPVGWELTDHRAPMRTLFAGLDVA